MPKIYHCRCGQGSFLPLSKFKLCEPCTKEKITKSTEVAIIDYGEEPLMLPLKVNLEKFALECFEDLQTYLLGQKLNYHRKIVSVKKFTLFELGIKETNDLVECEEWEFIAFKKFATWGEFYDTPWQKKPIARWFCSYVAMAGYKGDDYSKDFSYFDCEQCLRTVCRQNSRNGWHTQSRYTKDLGEICLQCFEKMQLENGISLEAVRQKDAVGMFFDDADLSGANFTQEGVYFLRGKSDPFFNRIGDLLKDNICVINYESLGIGGGEGTVSLWTKPRISATSAVAA